MSAIDVRFSARELRDLFLAWLALGVAFALFFAGNAYDPAEVIPLLGISLVTAGIGFLLHELAHKVVAMRFGQIAEFRANYPMLAMAIAAASVGFIFAAPGAVVHRGRITVRENGLIAIAGPITNVVLGFVFVPFLLAPSDIIVEIGGYGVLINWFLAAFNLVPYGPLDGRKVRVWDVRIFVVAFAGSILLLATAVLTLLW